MLVSSDVRPPGAVLLTDPAAGPAATVELLRWPADADRRAALAATGRPRILLLDPSTPPPMTWDPLEDWVREPAAGDEIQARAVALLGRPELGLSRGAVPVLDADGLLRHGGQWVAIPPVEARVLAALINRIGEVVHRRDLLGAGWPHGAPSDHGLDVRVRTLRRRLVPLGLTIHTVRGVGFLLEDPSA